MLYICISKWSKNILIFPSNPLEFYCQYLFDFSEFFSTTSDICIHTYMFYLFRSSIIGFIERIAYFGNFYVHTTCIFRSFFVHIMRSLLMIIKSYVTKSQKVYVLLDIWISLLSEHRLGRYLDLYILVKCF